MTEEEIIERAHQAWLETQKEILKGKQFDEDYPDSEYPYDYGYEYCHE